MSRSMSRLCDSEIKRLQRAVEWKIWELGLDPAKVITNVQTKTREISEVREKIVEWLASTVAISGSNWIEAETVTRGARLTQPEIGWLLKIDHSAVNQILKRIRKRNNQVAVPEKSVENVKP